MKKFFTIIFSSLVLMTSCNEEIQEDWTADSLTISCESLENAGDGNLKMKLPTEFSGKISLNIESNNLWKAEVSDITIQEEQWITLSSAEGTGNGTFDINIAPNNSAIDRIGSVVVTTTGNIPVKKTITLIQGNTDDMLSIGFDGIELPEGVTVKEGLYGSWNMVLPIGFSTDQQISVAISSTVNPSIEITYPEGLPADWLAETTLSGTSAVTFTVTANESNEYREALVTFTSKSGEVEVKKTLTVSQLGEEDIIWGGDYFQGSIEDLNNAEIILPSNTLQNVKIADLENITANNIELPEQEESDWFTVKIEDKQIFITTIKENSTTNKENVKELVLKSKLSKEEFKITVRQCMKGYGTILNKKLWTVTAEGTTRTDLTKLYDSSWSTLLNNVNLQLNQKDESESLILIIDLGEQHSNYNAVGLMPRLQWTAPAPRKISVFISGQLNGEWTQIINEGEYYLENDLKYLGPYNESAANLFDNHYEGIIKWAKLGEQTGRYVKVSMKYGSENTFYGSDFFCFDEIFVTKLSE